MLSAPTTMTKPRGRSTSRTIPDWAMAIKLRRIRLGLSQEDVAAHSGDAFTQRTVSALEVGQQQLTDMSYTRVIALARALNWTLAEMQRETGVDLGIAELTSAGTGV